MSGRFVALLILSLSGSAVAAEPSIKVELGPAVQARAGELGRSELDEERRSLASQVAKALVRAPSPAVSAELVISDIQPTRPTSTQLGRSPNLSSFSRGLGGAAITGVVIKADGSQQPIRYRYFPSTRADDLNFDTWGDAEEAFQNLAVDLSRGKPPYDTTAWPPPHAPTTLTGTRIPG